MDLTEAEDTKKRWQEYTEELYQRDLLDPDNHDDVITHPEPDILAARHLPAHLTDTRQLSRATPACSSA